MDKKVLDDYLRLMTSGSEVDASLALRAVQNMFSDEGVPLDAALRFAADNIDKLRPSPTGSVRQTAPAPTAAVKPVAAGAADCQFVRAGVIDISGAQYALPGAAATAAADIALNLKDALIAASLNKSRFKLKLVDVKNGRGEVEETILQAEYERAGMTPVRVWAHNRGEAGTLAALLRKAVAERLPDLAG